MRDYETMLIIDPMLEADATEAVIGRFSDVIEKNGGKVEKIDRWGKRKLTYPINGHADGYYAVLAFKGENATVEELDRVLRIADEIVRHTIVRRGKQ
ncbi:MAG: 30S ribosomal protein S6 [Actinobacteria bacterium]|nr:30S ribosomal protein S6 [Actinomycetota bacterium]